MSFLRIIEQHETRVRVEQFRTGQIVELEAGERVARGRSLDEAAAAWLAAEAEAELAQIAASGKKQGPSSASGAGNDGPFIMTETTVGPDGSRKVQEWHRRGDGTLIDVFTTEIDAEGKVTKSRGSERGPA